jgi:micrococcal nuclease
VQFLIALLAAGISLAATSPQPRGIRSEPVLVRSVVDGDTISVVGLGAVRLLGIDAPEVSHGFDTPEPFGREARQRLASLVLNRWVRLEMEGATTDVYNRRLAYVFTEDGQFINAVLVRDGLARVSARQPIGRIPELRRAETEAQAARRGMWGSAPASSSVKAAPDSKVRLKGSSAHRARRKSPTTRRPD